MLVYNSTRGAFKFSPILIILSLVLLGIIGKLVIGFNKLSDFKVVQNSITNIESEITNIKTRGKKEISIEGNTPRERLQYLITELGLNDKLILSANDGIMEGKLSGDPLTREVLILPRKDVVSSRDDISLVINNPLNPHKEYYYSDYWEPIELEEKLNTYRVNPSFKIEPEDKVKILSDLRYDVSGELFENLVRQNNKTGAGQLDELNRDLCIDLLKIYIEELPLRYNDTDNEDIIYSRLNFLLSAAENYGEYNFSKIKVENIKDENLTYILNGDFYEEQLEYLITKVNSSKDCLKLLNTPTMTDSERHKILSVILDVERNKELSFVEKAQLAGTVIKDDESYNYDNLKPYLGIIIASVAEINFDFLEKWFNKIRRSESADYYNFGKYLEKFKREQVESHNLIGRNIKNWVVEEKIYDLYYLIPEPVIQMFLNELDRTSLLLDIKSTKGLKFDLKYLRGIGFSENDINELLVLGVTEHNGYIINFISRLELTEKQIPYVIKSIINNIDRKGIDKSLVGIFNQKMLTKKQRDVLVELMYSGKFDFIPVYYAAKDVNLTNEEEEYLAESSSRNPSSWLAYGLIKKDNLSTTAQKAWIRNIRDTNRKEYDIMVDAIDSDYVLKDVAEKCINESSNRVSVALAKRGTDLERSLRKDMLDLAVRDGNEYLITVMLYEGTMDYVDERSGKSINKYIREDMNSELAYSVGYNFGSLNIDPIAREEIIRTILSNPCSSGWLAYAYSVDADNIEEYRKTMKNCDSDITDIVNYILSKNIN